MKQKKTRKINGWKWAFLVLLAAIVGLGLVLMTRTLSRREDTSQIEVVQAEEIKIGTFTTTRDQLNETISTYLEDYQTENFSYKVYASQQLVLFEGEYELWGQKIPLYIYFQPHKMEDGSIRLTVSELSAGTLALPKSEVLKFLQKNYKLPEFITIDVENANIDIRLTEIKNNLDISVKANTIDLYNDQIIFDIYKKKVNSQSKF